MNTSQGYNVNVRTHSGRGIILDIKLGDTFFLSLEFNEHDIKCLVGDLFSAIRFALGNIVIDKIKESERIKEEVRIKNDTPKTNIP